MSTLHVHFLPQLVDEGELAGGVAVVIDVLRATTTIIYALAAGAREVFPCLEIEDAWRLAATLPREQRLLGGERSGVKIEGFDLGNSPAEFTPATVGGKTLIFTTTNGTRAMLHCGQAAELILAAFVNLAAVCQRLQPAIADQAGHVHILCSGTAGTITREDVLLAGAIVDRLAHADPELNDSARIAMDAWHGGLAAAGLSGTTAAAEPARLAAVLQQSRGGRNLTRLKLEADILDAARIDRFAIVPRFDPRSGRLVP